METAVMAAAEQAGYARDAAGEAAESAAVIAAAYALDHQPGWLVMDTSSSALKMRTLEAEMFAMSAREAAEASTNAANNAINAMTLPASEAHQHATREQELAMYAAEEAADVARRLAGWLLELSGLAEAKMANVKEAISTLVPQGYKLSMIAHAVKIALWAKKTTLEDIVQTSTRILCGEAFKFTDPVTNAGNCFTSVSFDGEGFEYIKSQMVDSEYSKKASAVSVNAEMMMLYSMGFKDFDQNYAAICKVAESKQHRLTWSTEERVSAVINQLMNSARIRKQNAKDPQYIERAANTEFEPSLNQLYDMGFKDFDRNMQGLNQVRFAPPNARDRVRAWMSSGYMY